MVLVGLEVFEWAAVSCWTLAVAVVVVVVVVVDECEPLWACVRSQAVNKHQQSIQTCKQILAAIDCLSDAAVAVK